MDKTAIYRKNIQEVIKKHSGPHLPTETEFEIQNIFDTQNDHYMLVITGWHKNDRNYGCVIHMDIKNGKIWIQYDGTEIGVANELVELGVPKEDIILAFHTPYKRPYTDFVT